MTRRFTRSFAHALIFGAAFCSGIAAADTAGHDIALTQSPADSNAATADASTVDLIRIGGYKAVLQQHDMREIDASINFHLAIAAMLEGEAGRRKAIDANVDLFDDFAQTQAAFENGQLDALFCTTLDYFQIADQVEPNYIYTMSWDGKPTLTYSLMVNRNRSHDIKDLSDLRGRHLAISLGGGLAQRILSNRLQSEGYGQGSFELEKISRTRNSETAIVGLMFGQVDAALVPTIAVRQVARANPQSRQMLRTVFESDPFVPGVLVVRKGLSQELLDLADDRFANMHKYKAGKYVLKMFQAKKVVSVAPSDLEDVRVLFAGT